MTALKIKEKDLQKSILEYLSLRGHLCKRNQSGMMFIEKRAIKMGEAGWPDIIGCSRKTESLGSGLFIGIEVKTGTNKPTELQNNILNRIRERNGISIVAYSLDDVISSGL